ncbi:MAG TPA: hypothetical protein VIL32_16780, partial [Steroidobacteraceae bacterium]
PALGTSMRWRVLALAAMLVCLFVIATSDPTLLALSAAVVFLTCPLYPFVMRSRARLEASRAGQAS